ncbi:McrB family protein [Macellibacteroides fermentans]|uniref:AAA domain (Dynein-related subfamily) n=1 Tax=Parabacteroides chartae TaxID=1037355 RepID=A0A1T5BGI0_9BACT|nr:AAA family ATPase [Parabacteroides chartae]SKB46110.1 AAA domain (dynein-related subfamily) [Parabacteroides chartae]
MEKKIKVIHSQDAGLKASPKNSGETSLNLSTEIMEFILDPVPEKDVETPISFLLYKEDFLKGLAYIIANLPLYKSFSNSSKKIDFSESYFNELYSSIQIFFGDKSEKIYDVNVLRRSDSRNYINALRQGKFSIRDFLIEEISVLIFSKENSGRNVIRLDIVENLPKSVKEEVLEVVEYIEPITPRQIIYYGAPGTGKSYKIKEQLKGVPKENIFRTTFHPDSDYSTFVGSYKPSLSKKPLYGLNGGHTVRLNDGKDLDEETITYRFISQAFLNAYMQAYIKPDEDVYLIIEEINRGNCAQIFGDLFQLLDRDENGVSEYTIKADADLNGFLEKALGEDSDAIKNGELCLPSNLYIYATMNTSDQSLFPIDSAFKRRWDWEYEPIKYRNTDWMIDIQGRRYSWISFQKEINTRIFDATKSEDKMLGDYFVNPGNKVITDKMLLNKILFYLWNDVCKDGEGDIFKTSDIEDVSFSDLYGEGGIEKLINMMGYLGVEEFEEIDDDIDGEEVDNEDSGSQKEKDRTKYSINGYGKYPKKKLAAELVKLYVAKNQSMSAQEVVDKWKSLGQFVSHFIETQAEFDKRTDKARKEDVKIGSEFIYVSTNGWGGKGIMDKLINAIPKDWNLNVEEVQ